MFQIRDLPRIVVILFLFGFTTIHSQTYRETVPEDEEIVVQEDSESPTIFQLLNINNEPDTRLELIRGNSVFLQQIGDFNQASIKTDTENSDISVLQNGNSNTTQLEYTAQTAFADLKQIGNENNIKDYIFNPGIDISLDLIQEGDNLNFERFGANSITKSLIFRQTEAAPSLIIRSFN